MRSFVTYPLALVAASHAVTALVSREATIARFAELQARQAPGTPAYQCHSDCGNTILGADKDGYCDDSEWQGLLADCLVCANKFDIWKYYGNGVTSAAEGCGLDAVPSPTDSGPTSPPETSEPPTATEPPAETTSAPDSEPTASETSGPEPSGPEATGSETSGPEGSAPYPTATVSGAATGTGATSVAHTCVYLSGTCANQTFEQPSSSPTETFVSVSGAIKGRDIPAILALGLSVFAWVF